LIKASWVYPTFWGLSHIFCPRFSTFVCYSRINRATPRTDINSPMQI
jgi:hypothetical protein